MYDTDSNAEENSNAKIPKLIPKTVGTKVRAKQIRMQE